MGSKWSMGFSKEFICRQMCHPVGLSSHDHEDKIGSGSKQRIEHHRHKKIKNLEDVKCAPNPAFVAYEQALINNFKPKHKYSHTIDAKPLYDVCQQLCAVYPDEEEHQEEKDLIRDKFGFGKKLEEGPGEHKHDHDGFQCGAPMRNDSAGPACCTEQGDRTPFAKNQYQISSKEDFFKTGKKLGKCSFVTCKKPNGSKLVKKRWSPDTPVEDKWTYNWLSTEVRESKYKLSEAWTDADIEVMWTVSKKALEDKDFLQIVLEIDENATTQKDDDLFLSKDFFDEDFTNI